MANFSAPRGLSPVSTTTGAPFNEQGRLYYIASDSSNTYAVGDIVKSTVGGDANGVAQVVKAAATDIPLGVIVGFRAADPGVSLQGVNLDLTKIYLNKSAGARYAYVVDDSSVVFEVQSTNTAASVVGSTAVPNITADQTSTLAQSSPFSSTTVTIDASATKASMFQVIGVVQRPDNSVGANNKVLVAFNKHQFFGGFGA